MQTESIAQTNKVEVSLRRPTWKRFLKLFWGKNDLSILRILEYEILSNCQMSGTILDIGGGEKVGYFGNIFEQWTTSQRKYIYESINIDPNVRPTYLINSGDSIPASNNTYDIVFALNTFEHIYAINELLSEVFRVMRPGGKLIFTVPFIFRVHGCPDDYFRGTPSFWQSILTNRKFSAIQIEAINWGPFSTGLFVSGVPGPLKRFRRNLALILDILYYQLRYGDSNYDLWNQNHQLCNASLGYFITANKGTEDIVLK